MTNSENLTFQLNPTSFQADKTLINNLSSEYLKTGFTEERVSILKFEYENDLGSVLFNVDNFFTPSDGQFHLSAVLADICIQQIGVILSHMDIGAKVKDREIYLSSKSMKYRKPITAKKFTIDFEITKVEVKKNHKFYHANVKYERGAFVGKYIWVIPLIIDPVNNSV